MPLVDRPDVLEQGRVGLSPEVRVGGTGSISTLGLDESAAQEAKERRRTIGFRAPDVVDQDPGYRVFDVPVPRAFPDGFLAPALEAAQRLVAEKVERELRDLGECLWTARDTIVVYSDARGVSYVGRP